MSISPPTAQMTSDDVRVDPIVVVVATSGAIFVFADVNDTISRALDRTTLVHVAVVVRNPCKAALN